MLANFDKNAKEKIVSSCLSGISGRKNEEELVWTFEREFSERANLLDPEIERPVPFRGQAGRGAGNGATINIALAAIDSFELLLSLHLQGHPCPVDDICSELQDISQAAAQALDRFIMRRWFEESGHELEFIGISSVFQQLESRIKRVAKMQPDAPVLIMGERGSGKESVARALHYYSARRHKPFIAINSAALQHDLYSSELFGYRRGAFTGAVEDRLGKFRAADCGTLFLDEVTEIPQNVYGGLLRVLDRGEIQSLGYDRNFKVNVRILAATNKDIRQRVEEQRFPADIYDRLNVLSIQVPPLREHKEDIPLLVNYFFRKYCHLWELNEDRRACLECRESGAAGCLLPETMSMLMEYEWPGNIRELRNAVLWLITESGAGYSMTVQHLPLHILNALSTRRQSAHSGKPGLELTTAVRDHISKVLRLTKGNKSAAAKLLGMPLSTLASKMKRLKLVFPSGPEN